MKNKRLISFLITGLTILSNQAFAQLPAIDSMKLIPANPTSNDVLKVVCYTTFPSGSCNLNDIEVQQIGSDIFLALDYTVGAASYICNSIDTIEIDNPGAGNFQLVTTITTNQQDMIEDMDTMQFEIDPFLGINELHSNSFTIYPNPVQNELRFTADFTVKKLEITNLSGQRIHLIESVPNTTKIDLSDLKQGLYLVHLTNQNGNTFTQRMIKHIP